MNNRYGFVGELDFVGKGKVLDKVTNKEIEAEIKFKATIDELQNGKLNLTLVEQDDKALYETVVFDKDLD